MLKLKLQYFGEMQKSKMVEEASQIAVKGRGEKERCTHLNAEFQRIARR